MKEEERKKELERMLKDMFVLCQMLDVTMKIRKENALEELENRKEKEKEPSNQR